MKERKGIQGARGVDLTQVNGGRVRTAARVSRLGHEEVCELCALLLLREDILPLNEVPLLLPEPAIIKGLTILLENLVELAQTIENLARLSLQILDRARVEEACEGSCGEYSRYCSPQILILVRLKRVQALYQSQVVYQSCHGVAVVVKICDLFDEI